MSLTNSEVQQRFAEGKAGRSGTGNLRSERDDSDTATALRSYATVIAIRRDSDGAIFRNAHAYSITTTRHQSHSYDAPAVSFTCLSELMGSRWWETAQVLDSGPRSCSAELCRSNRQAQRDDYDAQWTQYRNAHDPRLPKPMIPYPDYGTCWHEGEEGHALRLPGYNGWPATAVLLDFPNRAQVLAGFELGKAVRYAGRSDQLWAALLPRWATDIVGAFDTLRPRDLEPDAARQGDLFFRPYTGRCRCVCHVDPKRIAADVADDAEADELRDALAAITTKDGRIKRHGCDPVGHMVDGSTPDTQSFGANVCKRAKLPPADAVPVRGLTLPAKGDRHVATDCYIRPDWTIWVRGYIEHPEHPRLHLAGWHTVERSLATRAVSSAYRAGGRAYAD